MKRIPLDRGQAEIRFAEVFAHLEFIAGYAGRRGARDPEGIAAEAMAIAWRRLAEVPSDDPRAWLILTTRNLLMAERRKEPVAGRGNLDGVDVEAPAEQPSPELDLDPGLAAGLSRLSERDREVLLLIAWEDLTPAQAAASLGITAAAFRVRLHRARRRLGEILADQPPSASVSTHEPNWRHT